MKNTKIVETLEKNLENLLSQYDRYVNEGETKKGIEVLRLIKETTNLIDNLDFEQMHGTYGIVMEGKDENGDNTESIKRVISVWEQNSSGQVRNHRVWEVGRELEIGTLRPLPEKFKQGLRE